MPLNSAVIARPLTLYLGNEVTGYKANTGLIAGLPEKFKEGLLLWKPEDLKLLFERSSASNEGQYDFRHRFSYPGLYYKKEVEVLIGPFLIENCWSAPADFLEIYSRLSSEDLLSGFAGFVEECLDKDLHILVFLDERIAEYPVDVIPILVKLLGSREVFAARVCVVDEGGIRRVYRLPTVLGLSRLQPRSRILSILTLVVLNLRPQLTPYTISRIISRLPEAVRVLEALGISSSPEAVRKRVTRVLEMLERLCLVESYEVSSKKKYAPSALGARLIRILTSFPKITELTRHTCLELRDFLRKVGSEGISLEPEAEG